MQGTTVTLMAEGKRGGLLVLPGWGLMRVSANAWDLIGIASSRGTRPVHKRVPGSKDGCQAFANSLLANTVLNLSKAVAIARSRPAKAGKAMQGTTTTLVG